MRAIHWILRNASGLTSLLQAPTKAGTTGADAIYIGHSTQDQEPSYITIDASTVDNYIDKDGGRTFIKESYSVYIYGRSYDQVKSIGEQVEAALDGVAAGQYNSQTLHSCRLVDESSLNTIEENVHYWLLVQVYEATLDSPQASTVGTSVPAILLTSVQFDGITPNASTYYLDSATASPATFITVSGGTPVTALTYSNNGQYINAQGTFSTMSPTTSPAEATGTYTIDTVTGISINSSTGVVTIDKSTLTKDAIQTATITFTANGSYSGTQTFEMSCLLVDNFVDVLTQAAYDGLGSYDAGTYYIIDDGA